jgi:hypothetical protein
VVQPLKPDENTNVDDNYFDVEPGESPTDAVANMRRSYSALQRE